MANQSKNTRTEPKTISASDLEAGMGLDEQGSDFLKASSIEDGIEISHREILQKKSLKRIITFFVESNILLIATIICYSVFERAIFGDTNKIITEKVVIAAIAGITIQAGSMIVVAFRGLFSSSDVKKKK